MTLRVYGGGTVFGEHKNGRQPSLLGLHGWGRTRLDLLEVLSKTDYQSVAFDLPGFGASPLPRGVWGATEYAELIADAIVEMGGKPLIVVGHSFGGRVATCLAANHAQLVAGLVLIAVPLLRVIQNPRPSLSYRVLRLARRINLISEKRIETARQRFGSDDYRTAEGIMRDVLVRVVNEDYREELGRIHCPVGLVWGAEDTAVPQEIAHHAAALLFQVVCKEVVKGESHDVHRTAPERVLQAIEAVVEASR